MTSEPPIRPQVVAELVEATSDDPRYTEAEVTELWQSATPVERLVVADIHAQRARVLLVQADVLAYVLGFLRPLFEDRPDATLGDVLRDLPPGEVQHVMRLLDHAGLLTDGPPPSHPDDPQT